MSYILSFLTSHLFSMFFVLFFFFLLFFFFFFFFFFFNDTATTEIYTLSYTTLFRSLSLAIAIFGGERLAGVSPIASALIGADRKSTRLNSSHVEISYAVFCLKKKKKKNTK